MTLDALPTQARVVALRGLAQAARQIKLTLHPALYYADVVVHWAGVSGLEERRDTVLICEDDETSGADLHTRVAQIPGVDAVQMCANSEDLLEIYGLNHPEIVLMRRVDSMRALLGAYPDAHVLLLTGSGDPEAAASAVAAGANGFLTRDGVDSGFVTAVAGAIAGRVLIGGEARKTRHHLVQSAPMSLTERELQVLRGMSRGQSNREIGGSLYLSEDTIKTHARRLFRKLGVNDRAKAVAIGFRRGWVS